MRSRLNFSGFNIKRYEGRDSLTGVDGRDGQLVVVYDLVHGVGGEGAGHKVYLILIYFE